MPRLALLLALLLVPSAGAALPEGQVVVSSADTTVALDSLVGTMGALIVYDVREGGASLGAGATADPAGLPLDGPSTRLMLMLRTGDDPRRPPSSSECVSIELGRLPPAVRVAPSCLSAEAPQSTPATPVLP